MRELIIIAVTALLSASAGAFIAVSFSDSPPPTGESTNAESADVAGLVQRIAALEQRLAAEDDQRHAMAAPDTAVMLTNEGGTAPEALATPVFDRGQRFEQRMQQRQQQIETRLRDAGWTDAEVESIENMRAAAALDMERQQYEAMRKAMEEDGDLALPRWADSRSAMRNSLGDDKYEQYLEALGRPSTVTVSNVLTGSAGDSAGLQPGDQIRRYGSERVFHDGDLMMAILQGEPGESVTIEVERDGTVFHMTVPRGPLGTSRATRFGFDF